MKSVPASLWWCLAGWILLNLLQAGLTELNPDEAYYWLYSGDLAWGYFDHPPATALMIRMGFGLFGGELGVRLFTVLLSGLGMILLWILAGRPRKAGDVTLLMFLWLAMPFVNVYGFIATPDSPLLFFSLLYYLLFQRLLRPAGFGLWLLWGASMAALMYSKYHGILVIGFSVLARPALLRDARFYLAAAFGVLLFTPHLYWQYAESFPSFRYHLLQRNNPFQAKHLIAYLLNQLLIFNPMVFPLLFLALLVQAKRVLRDRLPMQRVYVVTVIGFWLFFLTTVYRGHVEPQWTAVLSIPLVLLAFEFSKERSQYRWWLWRLILVSLLLLFLIRLVIVKGVVDEKLPVFHERSWVKSLKDDVGDVPVIFNNAYREPSLYSFYSKDKAYSNYSVGARRANQFNLWPWEEELLGKKVVFARDTSWACSGCREVVADRKIFRLKELSAYPPFAKASFLTDAPALTLRAGSRQQLRVSLVNQNEVAVNFEKGIMPLKLVALFHLPDGFELPATDSLAAILPAGAVLSQRYAQEYWLSTEVAPGISSLAPGEEKTLTLNFVVPGDWYGEGVFGVAIQFGDLEPFMPGALVPATVENGYLPLAR